MAATSLQAARCCEFCPARQSNQIQTSLLYFIPAGVLLAGGLGLMAWLTPGPQTVGGKVFDLHTMLLGMLCLFLGYQTLWLGAFAKIHGWVRGLLPSDFQQFLLEYDGNDRACGGGPGPGVCNQESVIRVPESAKRQLTPAS